MFYTLKDLPEKWKIDDVVNFNFVPEFLRVKTSQDIKTTYLVKFIGYIIYYSYSVLANMTVLFMMFVGKEYWKD